jgi:hypothetical protein
LESNIDFWLEQERYLPNLKELFFVLYNIPPASAAIERHFNVCSQTFTRRNTTMKEDLVKIRTMIKGNKKTMYELNNRKNKIE